MALSVWAYGISANTLLLSLGVTPVQASASIHIAEVATSGISGISHYGFGNVDMKLVKRLIVPGVIGAVFGALVLIWMPASLMKVFVGLYLLLMGGTILYKAWRKTHVKEAHHHIGPLGFFGGFFDAAGGGGWGTIVASTLVAKGSIPKTCSWNRKHGRVLCGAGFCSCFCCFSTCNRLDDNTWPGSRWCLVPLPLRHGLQKKYPP